MIIFLYGQDVYRSRQKLNETIEGFKQAHEKGLRLKRLDGKGLSFQDFKDEIQAASIFKEKKLIILNNISSNSELGNEILDFLKKNKKLDDIIIFYEEGKMDERKLLFKFLKKEAQSQEFNLLEGQRLRGWIEKEFEKYKVEIDSGVPDTLMRFVGNDLWQLSREVKKLATYKIKGRVTSEDVGLLSRPKIETDIFNTIDAISSQDKRRALSLLHHHLEKGDSPLYLFSMIKFQISNLLIVKDFTERHVPFSSIVAKSNLHPFVVKKSYGLSQKFSLEQLKKIYKKIFKLDIKIKTGKIDPVLALDILVTEI